MSAAAAVDAAGLAAHVERIISVDPEPWPNWPSLADAAPSLAFNVARFDLDAASFPASSIDVAICNQVYEYVADPRRLIENIMVVVKPGGVCYFARPNLLWPIEPHVLWPFVHWLPRRSAHALMKCLGSTRYAQLDAYSTTHWTLQRWFEEAGSKVVNLLRARVLAALDGHQCDNARMIASAIPDVVYRGLTPLSPGLVYLLVKPRADWSTLARVESKASDPQIGGAVRFPGSRWTPANMRGICVSKATSRAPHER